MKAFRARSSERRFRHAENHPDRSHGGVHWDRAARAGDGVGVSKRRERRIHSLLGPGFLTWEPDGDFSFTPDNGQPVRFDWSELHVGTPDYVRRSKRNRALECTPEEEIWITIVTRAGEVMAFQDEAARKG